MLWCMAERGTNNSNSHGNNLGIIWIVMGIVMGLIRDCNEYKRVLTRGNERGVMGLTEWL